MILVGCDFVYALARLTDSNPDLGLGLSADRKLSGFRGGISRSFAAAGFFRLFCPYFYG